MQSENKIARVRKARSVSSSSAEMHVYNPRRVIGACGLHLAQTPLEKALKNMQVYFIARKRFRIAMNHHVNWCTLSSVACTQYSSVLVCKARPRQSHVRRFFGSTPLVSRDL